MGQVLGCRRRAAPEPEAVEILEEVSRISSRVLGPSNPRTLRSEKFLGEAREKLARAAEAPVARRTRSNAEES